MGNESTAQQKQSPADSPGRESRAATADSPGSASRAAVVRAASWAAALALVLAGVGCALLIAHSMASKQASLARRDFHAGATAIASNLSTALAHEADLATAAGTFLAGSPGATPGQFAAWAGWAHALSSHPALRRLGLVVAVKRSHLRSFAARVGEPGLRASPAPDERARGVSVTPPGARPEYCLTAAEVTAGAALPTAASLDLCARHRRLLGSRGTATTVVSAREGAGGGWESLTPVYRGLAVPRSVAARDARFLGWVREALSPGVLARQALAGHPGYAVSLRYGPRLSDRAGAGSPPAGSQSAQTSLPGGWRVTSFGPPATASLLGNGRAWLPAAGLAIGALLGLLALLLGRRGGSESATSAPAAPVPAEPVVQIVDPLYDPLTGLPSRALTLDRANLVLARAGRQSGLLAGALVVDVDWFKHVNDKLGREAGDQLLKIVAERLQAAMRTEDTVGRLDGDRFAVLVECTARSLRLDALAQRVLESLHSPLGIDGFGPSFSMTASIGVAFGRYDAAEDLLAAASTALEAAKADGKGRYKVFDASAKAVIDGRGELEADLGAAVQENALTLLYEPIHDLRSQSVAGLEAMPGWTHPVNGQIAGEELRKLAEDCGLIVPVDRWVLEQACAQAAASEVAGRRLGITVKLGEQQLHRDGLLTDIRRALQGSGVDPGLITLSISENAVMSDVAAAAERLQEIKRLGVRLAIEDFGDSGYAYHSDLRSLPIDSLRVDRCSLAASDDPDYRNWLFEAILMVGRELSLTIVAKGLQTEQEAREAAGMGCVLAQGPALGGAVAADAVQSLGGAAGSPALALAGQPDQPA